MAIKKEGLQYAGGMDMKRKSPRQLYLKLLCIHTALIVGIVGVLTVYFLSVTSQRFYKENETRVRNQGEKTVSYLQQSARYMGFMITDLYQSEEELSDLRAYLSLAPVDYQKYRLDTYSFHSRFVYQGFDRLVEKFMEGGSNMDRILVVSYKNQDLTTFFPDGKQLRRKIDGNEMRKLASSGIWDENELIYGKEIRDPYTMKALGYMMGVFQKRILSQNQTQFPGCQLLVYSKTGHPLFSTLPPRQARGLLGSWMERVQNGEFTGPMFGQDAGDYTVISWMWEGQAKHVPWSLFFMILGIGAGIIVLGSVIADIYLKKLTKRLNGILSGMEEVTRGNLSIRISTRDKKDELDMIADHFNYMCKELDTWIEKSYQAEIDQKNAQMAALQNQINPHFLYNTLESIRMKAICNGDRDVGKMLYGLAVLFRGQLKDADVINLAQELHYCKKYLELFEFRYQENFHAQVECREEYLQLPIIKFVIQPIIENYFEHGIRMEAEDNFLSISVREEGGEMRIYVKDNGKGMPDGQIAMKNKELSENKSQRRESIGFTNVNRRLKAAYGPRYGISLEPGIPKGLVVILHFPAKAEGGDRG